MPSGRAIPNVRLPRIGDFIGAFLLVPCPRAVRGLAMRGHKREPVLSDSIHYELQYRSEEHTSELQSLMRSSYAVFCLKKKNKIIYNRTHTFMRTSYTLDE